MKFPPCSHRSHVLLYNERVLPVSPGKKLHHSVQEERPDRPDSFTEACTDKLSPNAISRVDDVPDTAVPAGTMLIARITDRGEIEHTS